MGIGLKVGDDFVHLSRGDSFEVEVEFMYKGPPQKLTFELVMRHGAFATEYPCVPYPTRDVAGITDWGASGPLTLTYKVPSGADDGGQDLRMHITTEDGKEEYSSWLTDVILIS